MTIENAIKMAIDGGYKPKDCEYEKITSVDISRDEIGVMFTEEFIDSDGEEDCKWMELTVAEVFLDPLFWQALGKEMNWIDERGDGEIIPDWENPWHKFISHLANGGTPDSYFKSLN